MSSIHTHVHEQATSGATATVRHGHSPAWIGWWPSLLGIGIVVARGVDSGVSVMLASVVAVIALIYVGVAVTGRPADAWWGLLLSVPVVMSGHLTGMDSAPFMIMAPIAVALVVVGRLHGVWADPANRAQLFGLVGFGIVAVAAALSSGTVAALLIAAGLAAHAIWDVVHLIRNKVVARRYAELCTVLDAGLAAVIIWATL